MVLVVVRAFIRIVVSTPFHLAAARSGILGRRRRTRTQPRGYALAITSPTLNMTVRLVLLSLAAGALLAGCAGGGAQTGDAPGSFAGYSKGEAVGSATYVLRSQLADPASPLFQKELEVGEVEEGRMSDGTNAWVAHLEDFDRNPSPWCLLVRAGQTNSPTKPVVYDLQRCNAVGK